MKKIIKLNKVVDMFGNRKQGEITINDGKIVSNGSISETMLWSEDIYDYNNESFTESLSMENLDFFIQAESSIQYKHTLLECIDYFYKESYIKIFIKYAMNLKENIKQKFKHEFDVEEVLMAIKYTSAYNDNYVYSNNDKKVMLYQRKINYSYWEGWLDLNEYIYNIAGNSDWQKRIKAVRALRVRALRNEYHKCDYVWTNTELACKLDKLLSNPRNWSMFDNPEQAHEDFQAYVNKFSLEKLHEYSYQVADKLDYTF